MGTLNRIFQDVSEAAMLKNVIVEVLARQLAKQGTILSVEQRSAIERHLENFDFKNTQSTVETIDLDACGLGDDFPEGIEVDLSECEDWDQIIEDMTKNIGSSVPGIVAQTSSSILDYLMIDAPRMHHEHQLLREGFGTRLAQKWGSALNLLEMLVVIAVETGDNFNKEFRPAAVQASDFMFDALVRLHTRGCQVASEVLLLLRAGYADGAHARWRTLHEISVVASFIKQSGNDVAERYLLHDHVESRKAAHQYQNNLTRLGIVSSLFCKSWEHPGSSMAG